MTQKQQNQEQHRSLIDTEGQSEDDDNDPSAVFIKPNIDIKLSADKRRECRDIVKEIMNFGVSQRQVLFIMQLLALELESRDVMVRVLKAVTESRDEVPTGMIEIPK